MFQAISDPIRREILGMLAEREYPVGELSAAFPVSRPAISQHLRVLLDAGLAVERRSGRYRVYSLRVDPLLDVRLWVSQYDRFWRDKLDALGEHLGERDG